ncbi:MAG: radical SAM protein, partial [Deltaproteobacteria bacterium]|nr:radical SAM protein [Deltaproteobacteria bacterium]
DHRRGQLLKLNRSAGSLLERIDHGAADISHGEVPFLEQLVDRGVVIREGGTAPPPAGGTAGEAPASRDGALIDELNAYAEARRIPLHCQLELTHRCGLGCAHCYLPAARRRARPDAPGAELTTAEIRRFLDALAGLGGLFLALTGGDPFLRPDLEAIFDHARDRRFAVSLLTSGHGADRGALERMAARGIDTVQVSLHGADAAAHDRFTGVSGSFDEALGLLAFLAEIGAHPRAAVTVTRRNRDRLEETLERLHGMGVPAALTLYLQPRRDGRTGPQKLAISEREIAEVLAIKPPVERPRFETRSLEDPMCSLAGNVVSVGPTGLVYPCLSFRRAGGSLRDDPLEKIWKESSLFEYLRKIRIADLADCPECEVRATCNRCPGFAVAEGLTEREHTDFDCCQSRVLALLSRKQGG